MTRKIVFVTGNANKLAEVQAILSDGTPLVVESQNFDLPELQGTTEEIAAEKCKRAAELVGGPCITEDTSLSFKALGGLPGPYIKWFHKELGNEGLLKLLEGFPTKEATAVSTFGYCPGPGQEAIIFEGRKEGRMVPSRGPPNFFAWNPIFEVDGTGMTFAEMPIELKNKISHRFQALQKLREYLQEHPPSSD
ncbi:hypothetical protein M422DRAFT_219150 [Sphaerobolus stellatus SS14]|nr:hypothetical protein M422DRAFT_219150 [Sphaerobolus stellatus SS14]